MSRGTKCLSGDTLCKGTTIVTVCVASDTMQKSEFPEMLIIKATEQYNLGTYKDIYISMYIIISVTLKHSIYVDVNIRNNSILTKSRNFENSKQYSEEKQKVNRKHKI